MADNITQLIIRLKDEISQNAGNMNRSLNNLERNIKSFAGTLGIGLGVGAVVSFGKHLIDLGDQLSDLSDQTKISIGVLAGLKSLAEQSGTSVEAFATGINRLMVSLVEGSDKTGQQAQALKRLGFTIDEVRESMSDPEGFLEAFAKKLSTITNQAERLAVAKALAGKSAAELVPALMKIAEEGLPRVSKATEEAYRTLGELKDKTVGAGAAMRDFFAILLAAPFQIFQSNTGKIADQIDVLEKRLQNLLATPNLTRDFEQRRAILEAQIKDLYMAAGTKAVPPAEPNREKKTEPAIDKAVKEAEALALARAKTYEEREKTESAMIERLQALERELTLESLDESEKRVRGVIEEMSRRIEVVQDALDQQIISTQEASAKEIEITQRGQSEINRIRLEAAEILVDIPEDMNEQIEEVTKFQERAFERMHDAMADTLKAGLQGQIKSWEDLGTRVKSLFDSIASEYLAMMLKMALFGEKYGTAGGSLGGLLGWLFGMGGGGAPSLTGSAGPVSLGAGVPVYHGGGLVGEAGSMRLLSGADFAGVRRYHSGGMPGLRSNEVPAVLQRGEEVLTRGDPRHRRSGGGGQTINFHVQATDAGSFMRSESQIKMMIARAVRSGQRKL